MNVASLSFFDYIVLAVYILFLVGTGVYFSRSKKKNTEEYLLGSRRVPWWAAGVSNYVALLSTLSLVAVPGEAFNHGISLFFTGMILPLAAIGAFLIFGRFYFRSRIFTPYAYLEKRFDASVKMLAAVLFWLMRFMYLGVVLYSCAKIFEGTSGWPVWFSITLMGMVSIIYTSLGGLKAIIWTDVVQFLLIAGGLVTVLLMCTLNLPFGVFGIIDFSFKNGRGFEYFKDPQFYSLSPFIRLNLWVMIISAISNEMFAHGCDQMSIQKLLSTPSYGQAMKSVFTYSIIALPASVICYLIGLAIFVFYSFNPVPAGTITGDTALFHFIATRLHSPLPGLILAGFLAAAMTTISAGFNSLATVATKDFYYQYFKSRASEERQLIFSRYATLVIGLMVVGFGLVVAGVNERVGQTMIELTSLWFAFFLPLWLVFFLGMTSTKIDTRQIFISLGISSLITAVMVVWYLFSKGSSRELSFMVIGLPGLFVMLISGYTLALFSKPLDAHKINNLTFWTLSGAVGDCATDEEVMTPDKSGVVSRQVAANSGGKHYEQVTQQEKS